MPMLFNPIIQLKNVSKKYSTGDVFQRSLREDFVSLFKKNNASTVKNTEFWALRNVTIDVEQGECIGLYGPNGAGKSTILKLIASVTYPTVGELTVQGKVAPLIEIGAGFHPDLTGKENIYINGTILGMKIHEINKKIGSIIAFSELERFANLPVKKYSTGMYLRLAFSIAIHSEADIYLIDEILTVGDEVFQGKCLEKIYEIKKNKKTLIVVTHDRSLMERVADKIIFIKRGEIGNITTVGQPMN